MKDVTSDFINAITSGNPLIIADLFTFTTASGISDYFTNADVSILVDSNVYKANSLRVDGLRLNIAVGIKTDEQDLKIIARPGETLCGSDFFSGLQSGLLDGGTITRKRAFWVMDEPLSPAVYLTSRGPAQVVPLFIGLVSTIEKIGRTYAELKIKSPLALLDVDMPRNSYQPGCLWALYDSGCTIVRASYTTSYTVSSASKTEILPTTAIANVTGADGEPYYAQGRLLFTSGVNSGLQVSVRSNDASKFYLTYPLITAPGAGDTFNVSAGCAKTTTACNLKFSNINNFRAFPRVPPVTQSF